MISKAKPDLTVKPPPNAPVKQNSRQKSPLINLAGQTAVYGLGTIIPRLLNYLLVPFYTRVFSQEAYGQITELYAYVAFLLVFLTYGMETAFFRFAQKGDSHKVFNTVWSSIIASSSVFVLLIVLFYKPLAFSTGYDAESLFVVLIALIVALDAVTAIPFAGLRQRNKARVFAFIKIANVTFNIGFNILFLVLIPTKSLQWSSALLGPDSGLVVWVFVSNLLASLITLLLLLPHTSKFRFQLNLSLLRPMLNYALPVLVVGLAGMVNEVIDKLLLKHLLPDPNTALAQVGIYGANYKLAVLMTLFIQVFRYAVEPFFFANAEKKGSPELFARVTNYFIIFGLLIFLLVTLYLDFFKLLIGPAFHDGLDIVPIILMANLFYGIFFNLSVWYKVTDRTRYGAAISLIGASITLLLNILLIPKWGYYGSAWAHFVCYLAMMAISYLWGKRFYKVPYKLLAALGYTTLAAFLYGLSTVALNLEFLPKIIFNSFIFMLFLLTALFFERRRLAQQRQG
jgi:O-antigen/teichoic acid export membrane protein